MDTINRREFLRASVCAVAATAAASDAIAATDKGSAAPTPAEKPVGKLIVSSPILMNAAETSVGVTFEVGADASGWVEYSDSPDMSNAVRAYSGGRGLKTVDDRLAHIRLTGLKPSARYWYRIGADRISYKNGYAMKNLGLEIDPKVRSFSTLGAGKNGTFCVINDTHDRKDVLDLLLSKIGKIKPTALVWNGDATNVTETKDHAIRIFLHTHENHPEYAAETPLLFVNGNHDLRGRFARSMEELLMLRDPAERSGEFYELGRNFVQRMGDVALIGMDTGEDKLDTNPLFAGIYRMREYREKQARWLEETVKTPAVATAKYKVVFCHIPLFDSRPNANPGDLAPADTAPGYPKNWAAWQRTCANLWGPIFERAGVQLVIAGHQHCFRYDAPTAERPWAQIVGGGCGMDKTRSDYPTVIQGSVKDGKLQIVIHDVLNDRIAGEYTFDFS